MSVRQCFAIVLTVTVAALFGRVHLAEGGIITYPDFSSTTGLSLLSLVGDAAQAGSALRVSTIPPGSTGAAWYTTKQNVASGFETIFEFQITDQHQSSFGEVGGDGFAFVIQNAGTSALGFTNYYMGYEIENSLAVEFDTFYNSWWLTAPATEPSKNHVGVQSRGTVENTASHDSSTADAFLGVANVTPNMSDGALHTAKITYYPGSLKIFVDDLNNPYLDVSVDLDTLLDLDSGKAYVGFTAGGATATENHDITQWTFASNEAVPEPSTFTIMGLGILGYAGYRCRRKRKAA